MSSTYCDTFELTVRWEELTSEGLRWAGFAERTPSSSRRWAATTPGTVIEARAVRAFRNSADLPMRTAHDRHVRLDVGIAQLLARLEALSRLGHVVGRPRRE